jgi:hypothetical protein
MAQKLVKFTKGKRLLFRYEIDLVKDATAVKCYITDLKGNDKPSSIPEYIGKDTVISIIYDIV